MKSDNITYNEDFTEVIDSPQHSEKVVLPNTIEIIDENAFKDTFLKEISFPDSLIKIEPFAFNNTDIRKVKINNPVVICTSVFGMCRRLEDIKINTKVIPDFCFAWSGTESNGLNIHLENTISIEDSAFSYTNINKLNLPNTLKTIGSKAFLGAHFKQNKLFLPFGLKEIKEHAFFMTSGLTDIYLPATVEFISTYGIDEPSPITYHTSKKLYDKMTQCGMKNIKTYDIDNLINEMTFKEANDYILGKGMKDERIY